MPSKVELFSRHPNKFFVETGTYRCEGLENAIASGCFQRFLSVELSQDFAYTAHRKFKDNPEVQVFQGDSSKKLPTMLSFVTAPATIWLDAHYSAGDTAKGDCMSPILQELQAIQNHDIDSHTILIDDSRDFGTENFDFVTKEEVIEALMKINPKYQISYDTGWDRFPNDVLVAQLS